MSRLSGGRLASQLTFLNFKSASSAGTIIFYFPRGPLAYGSSLGTLRSSGVAHFYRLGSTFLSRLSLSFVHISGWQCASCMRCSGTFFRSCLVLEICSGAQCSYAAIAQDTNRSMTTSYISTCSGNSLRSSCQVSQTTMEVENTPSFKTRFLNSHNMKSDSEEDKYTRKAKICYYYNL